MGRCSESRHPLEDRFHPVPWPWNDPGLHGDDALHEEAAVGANREGHGGLAGRRSVDGCLLWRKSRVAGMATLIVGSYEGGGRSWNSLKSGGAIICPIFQWGSTIAIVKRPHCIPATLSAIPVVVVTVQDPPVTEQKARKFGDRIPPEARKGGRIARDHPRSSWQA